MQALTTAEVHDIAAVAGDLIESGNRRLALTILQADPLLADAFESATFCSGCNDAGDIPQPGKVAMHWTELRASRARHADRWTPSAVLAAPRGTLPGDRL